jgi:hypothetical protein
MIEQLSPRCRDGNLSYFDWGIRQRYRGTVNVGDVIDYVVTKLDAPKKIHATRYRYSKTPVHDAVQDQPLRPQRRHEGDACFRGSPAWGQMEFGQGAMYPLHANYQVGSRYSVLWQDGVVMENGQCQLTRGTRVRVVHADHPDSFVNVQWGGEMSSTDKTGKPFRSAPRTVGQMADRLQVPDAWSGRRNRFCCASCPREHQPVRNPWCITSGEMGDAGDWDLPFLASAFCGGDLLQLRRPSRRQQGLEPLSLSLQVLTMGVRQRSNVRKSLRRKLGVDDNDKKPTLESLRWQTASIIKTKKRIFHEPWNLLADPSSVRLKLPRGFADRGR